MGAASTGKRAGVRGEGTRSRRGERTGKESRKLRIRRQRLGWKDHAVWAGAAAVAAMVAWAAIARAIAPTGNTTQDHFDVLLVLGSPADSDGNPTPVELERVTEAVNEYERGVAAKIIFTGGAAHNRFVEAEVMARVAEAQGIPAAAIVEERTARDTMENACDSLKIMRNHGWISAEVISSASHLPRVGLILSRLPLKWRVHAAPAIEPDGAVSGPAMTALEILKTVHYLVWSRYAEKCEGQ